MLFSIFQVVQSKVKKPRWSEIDDEDDEESGCALFLLTSGLHIAVKFAFPIAVVLVFVLLPTHIFAGRLAFCCHCRGSQAPGGFWVCLALHLIS